MKPVLDFLVSALPVALLVHWMTRKKSLPSNLALPLAALLLYTLLHSYFGLPALHVHAAVVKGLLTALTPILIVGGAILLFKSMEHSGAMATVRQWLNHITTNRVAQLMIVGWAFSYLVEGVSGFGTPAALAAPLLVGLGFAPLPVAVLCLMMNTIPVSFGAVGMPTWFGLGGLGLTEPEMRAVALKTALLHAGAALVIPALRVVVTSAEIRANLRFVLLVIGFTMLPSVGMAAWNVEFPTIAGGVSGLLAAVWLARHGVGLAPEARPDDHARVEPASLVKATFPLWSTVIILVITRVDALGLKAWLTSPRPALVLPLEPPGELLLSASLVAQWRHIFGTDLHWTHPLLYVPSLLPFVLVSTLTFALFRTPRSAVKLAWRQTLRQVLKPIGAFFGALILVELLMTGGTRSCAAILGDGLARAAGGAWQFAAVYLGALGSFFSGSNTVSNLTFGSIQSAAATSLGLSRTTILSLQSVGGAMGNMVCIHNIVAVCSILGLHNQEGNILRQTFRPVLLYGLLVSGLSILFRIG